MDQTNVGNGTQETETGLPATPNQGATLARGAVEGRSIISSPTSAPPEVPAVNPHLLLDNRHKVVPKGDSLPPAREAGRAFCDGELRNAIERAVIMAKGTMINLEDLPAELRGQTVAGGNGSNSTLQIGSLVSVEQLEEAHLRKVL